MDFFQHPQAIVESKKIGKNTRIWAFAHILPNVVIGDDCNICDHTFIENDVVIGDRVTIKSGVQLWDGIHIEDDVFIGPNATFTNDPFPRSKQHIEKYSRTLIQKGASIGANATILPGITIGRNSMVGAGAVVTHNVPPNAIAVGNPARIKGYVNSSTYSPITTFKGDTDCPIIQLGVGNSQLFNLLLVTDLRGNLTFTQYPDTLPFLPQRCFIVSKVPSKEIRGEHAHRNLHQFLLCVNGSCSVVLHDGEKSVEVVLDQPNLGLYVPPMVWATQYKYSEDAVLVVLASDIYDAADYIRDYDLYAQMVKDTGEGRDTHGNGTRL
jgi:UDP-2-acetamido-3-amino-2,3-dideoxy-glucuronate N-acetyltransferase